MENFVGCIICGMQFLEGWLDGENFAEETCDDCKREIDELSKPTDQEILDLLSDQPFVKFEMPRHFFVEGE